MNGESLQTALGAEWQGTAIADAVERVLTELVEAGRVTAGQIVVIGTSTSEVIGKRIGTGGTQEAAAQIFEGVRRVRAKAGFYPAFQCCEHLNRALVVDRELMELVPSLEQVTVVPVPGAGGSMAAYAYTQLDRPVVVETIQAHAGLDIGSTLIGMHLKRVAVPLRPSIRLIGHAPVTMAYTRPKLIGGARAVYEQPAPAAASAQAAGSNALEPAARPGSRLEPAAPPGSKPGASLSMEREDCS